MKTYSAALALALGVSMSRAGEAAASHATGLTIEQLIDIRTHPTDVDARRPQRRLRVDRRGVRKCTSPTHQEHAPREVRDAGGQLGARSGRRWPRADDRRNGDLWRVPIDGSAASPSGRRLG